jgi:hypothetical protein
MSTWWLPRLFVTAAGLLGILVQGHALITPAGLALLLAFSLAWKTDSRPFLDRAALLDRFFPCSWGILLWVMRPLYWDRFDWGKRLSWLLLALTLVYGLRVLRQTRLVSVTLHFFSSLTPGKRGLTVFTLTLMLFSLAVWQFERQGVGFGGDEPHYLVIAQSLARDGDFNIANQYYEHQYRDYIGEETLGWHGYFGKNGRHEIYSIHLPGVAISITPLLWIIPSGRDIVWAVRLLLAAYAALLFLVLYLCTWRLLHSARAALLVTLTLAATAPLFFHSFHLYPEVQVMLLLLSSLYLRYLSPARNRPWALLLSGLLLGLLLFWGVKYATLLYLYAAGALIGFVRRREWRSALLFMVGPLLMQGLFWAYLYGAYGNFSPGSIYMNAEQKSRFMNLALHLIPLKLRIETFLNYLFDQRDGLLLYAPVYVMALAGFWTLVTRYRRYKTLFWLTLPALIYIGSYAFLTHRGGYCPQGRPLAPITWALMLLVLVWARHSRQRWMKRVLLPGLAGYGFFITFTQLFNPFTLYQSTTRDVQFRPGLLFQQLGNAWMDLTAWLPSYIKTDGNELWWPNAVFLLLFILLTTLGLMRRRIFSPTLPNGLWLPLWMVLFVVFPRFPHYNPILVQRPEVATHRLYGISPTPHRATGRTFLIRKNRDIPLLLSPLQPLSCLDLSWKNAGTQPLTAKIWNFDRLLWSGEIAGSDEGTIKLGVAEMRRFHGEDLIQLKMEFRTPGQADAEVEILPRGRERRGD